MNKYQKEGFPLRAPLNHLIVEELVVHNPKTGIKKADGSDYNKEIMNHPYQAKVLSSGLRIEGFEIYEGDVILLKVPRAGQEHSVAKDQLLLWKKQAYGVINMGQIQAVLPKKDVAEFKDIYKK